WIGGSCPNINCLPSKNEIWSAKVSHLMHHAAQYGAVTGAVAVDMARVRQRKREMVELDERGYIRVNERVQTSAPDVWAIGECAASPQCTHVSADDFRVMRDNLAGGDRTTRGRPVPYCMFADPPLAHVGLTESDARRQGIGARVAQLPMSAVLRTWTTGEKEG